MPHQKFFFCQLFRTFFSSVDCGSVVTSLHEKQHLLTRLFDNSSNIYSRLQVLLTSKLNSGKPQLIYHNHMNLIIFPASSCPSSSVNPNMVLHSSACLLQDFCNLLYCSLAKERPWAEHLTRLPKRGVGALLSI